MIEIVKGAAVAASISEKIKNAIEGLSEGERRPKLAIIRVGERPDDLSYERGATKRMGLVGIDCQSYVYDQNISNDEFVEAFQTINQDPDVDGILLLRPLPAQINESYITAIIDPQKDVDCISPTNMARLFMGEKGAIAPCTAQAVMEMLSFAEVDLKGKNATIIGRSMVVGKPLAMLMIAANATVTVCHTKTVDTPKICREGDIIVACAGSAKMVDSTYVSELTEAVIDVGINVDENGKLCGDVDFEAVANDEHGVLTQSKKRCVMTTVPGGVGAVTTSVLAKNVFAAYCRKQESKR